MEESIKDQINRLRTDILNLGNSVCLLHRHSTFSGEQLSPGQHSEMRANLTLSYRHLEDARMRLGKVLQASEGGVSCYDR